MEKIKYAAIKYFMKGEDTPQYVYGHCHAACIDTFSFMEICSSMRDLTREVQGYMTTRGRFVDRVEAMKIAREANQLRNPYNKKTELDSYDVDLCMKE